MIEGKSRSDLKKSGSAGKYESYLLKHEREDHNLLSISKEKDFTCDIEYSNDETLDIKEEFIEDHGNCSKRDVIPSDNRKCQLKVFKKNQAKRKKKIQDSKEESGKKYKCDTCARSYNYKGGLTKHKKFACGVMPQFKCEFCNKRFTQKISVDRHVDGVHFKTKSKTPQTRHNCDKCSRNYQSLTALNNHKRLDHAAIKHEFICDYCSKKTKQKAHLAYHIASLHLKRFTTNFNI